MAYVSRDPFAREETHRTSLPAPASTSPVTGCAWCGNLNGRGGLYRYRTETDGGRTNEDTRAFCSIDCRRTYYGT